jgi:hypothetical protein
MSSPSDMTINFAQYAGFSSLAAAIVFAVAYSPLLLVFAKRAFTLPTYVHNVLVFFCASKYIESFQNVQFIIALVRVTAFVIRAVMIGVESAGENLNLLIADQILFGIGYAGLLYSSYTLVLDLYVTSDIFSISTLTIFDAEWKKQRANHLDGITLSYASQETETCFAS